MRRAHNPSRGFTLLELMISAAIGAVLLVVATQVFSRGVKAAWVTSQRAELQQDFRAAGNILQRDISMAGAGALGQQGLSTSAVGLPNTATRPVYPCSGLVTCNYINGAPVAYPLSSGAPYLYSVIPGPNLGITVNAAQGPTDILTVVYADANLALNCYIGTMDAAGTVVTFQLPAALPGTCVLPNGAAAPAPLTFNAVGNPTGLQIGDMIMFGTNAVGDPSLFQCFNLRGNAGRNILTGPGLAFHGPADARQFRHFRSDRSANRSCRFADFNHHNVAADSVRLEVNLVKSADLLHSCCCVTMSLLHSRKT